MEWLLGISSANAEVGTQEGTTSSTSTGTDSEAEEAKKKRQKVERQRERRAEQKAAQLASTEWVSQRQPSSPKARLLGGGAQNNASRPAARKLPVE